MNVAGSLQEYVATSCFINQDEGWQLHARLVTRRPPLQLTLHASSASMYYDT